MKNNITLRDWQKINPLFGADPYTKRYADVQHLTEQRDYIDNLIKQYCGIPKDYHYDELASMQLVMLENERKAVKEEMYAVAYGGRQTGKTNFINQIQENMKHFIDLETTGLGMTNFHWNLTTTNYKKATEEEVQEMLLQEAEKRGFKEGAVIESLVDKKYTDTVKEFWHLDNHGKLWFLGNRWGLVVFDQGKWAKIIEKPVKKLTIEQISKKLGYKIEVVE